MWNLYFRFKDSGCFKALNCQSFFLLSIFIPQLVLSDALVRISDLWQYAKGSQIGLNDQQPLWYSPDFNDSSWKQASGGFVGGFTSLQQATRFSDFGSGYHSVFFRTTFEITDPEEIQWLILRLQFKHGLILWLNGHSILNAGFSDRLAGDVDPLDRSISRADNLFEELLLNQAIPFLRKGQNTLAAQVHASLEQTSFAFVAELSSNFSREPMIHHLTPNSALISWKTPIPVGGKVRYGLVKEYLTHSVDFEAITTEPEVNLISLKSGCVYYYQIEFEAPLGQVNSKVASFKTPDWNDKKLRFAVVGDSGRGTTIQYRIAEQIRLAQPDLVFHTGDTVYPSLTPELVDLRYYSIYGSHMTSTPYYVATGNHDLDAGRLIPASVYHRPTNDTLPFAHAEAFTFPESYYTVRQGPAQFFVLFAPFFYQYVLTKESAQYEWLERELRKSNSPWKFIVMHHPVRTSSLHRFDDYNHNSKLDTSELAEVVLPLAEQYGVQMVFSGHDHVFERFLPDHGIVSVTTAGGGGTLYPLRERDSLSSQFRSQHHFVNIEIEGDTCRLVALDDTENVIDTFIIRRESSFDSSYASSWHSPVVENEPSRDEDGNLGDQRFDFFGPSLIANLGEYSHSGALSIHNDEAYLYLGFQSVALPDDGALMLFLGIDSEQSGTGGTDLEFLNQVEFDGWKPLLIGVLGDEFADGTQRDFNRSGKGILGPQGIFHAGRMFKQVEQSRIQQFNLNPQISTISLSDAHLSEQNANYIEVAIPLASMPGLLPGDSVRLSALTGRQPTLETEASWSFDKSMIGGHLSEGDQGQIVLTGVTVKLSLGADNDGDGLTSPEEQLWHTDPNDVDTDGDGLPDGWEVLNKLSPIRADMEDGKLGDLDGDGQSNYNEWLAKTDPNDASSKLFLRATFIEKDVIQLKWASMPGVHYQLQSSQSPIGPFVSVDEPFYFDEIKAASKIIKKHVSSLDHNEKYFRLVVDRGN